jgi:hypothetical protein
MIIQHLGMKEVHYIEKHTGEKVRAELISPPGKESGSEGPQDMESKTAEESSVSGDAAV